MGRGELVEQQQIESQIREAVFEFIRSNKGLSDFSELTDDCSLIDKHLLDSIDFIEMLSELEEKIGVEFDAENIEFAKLATLNGLCKNYINNRN